MARKWDDWVEFNNVINDVLDKWEVDADVWSTPQETRGKMWIRKGTRRRIRYDWHERSTGWGQPLRIWNNGTDDQFVEEKEAANG